MQKQYAKNNLFLCLLLFLECNPQTETINSLIPWHFYGNDTKNHKEFIWIDIYSVSFIYQLGVTMYS